MIRSPAVSVYRLLEQHDENGNGWKKSGKNIYYNVVFPIFAVLTKLSTTWKWIIVHNVERELTKNRNAVPTVAVS